LELDAPAGRACPVPAPSRRCSTYVRSRAGEGQHEAASYRTTKAGGVASIALTRRRETATRAGACCSIHQDDDDAALHAVLYCCVAANNSLQPAGTEGLARARCGGSIASTQHARHEAHGALTHSHTHQEEERIKLPDREAFPP
jgi:hypothetical protein